MIGGSAPPPAARALAADLAAHDSATEVLGRWCARLRLADPPVIRAERDLSAREPSEAAARRRLRPAAGQRIAWRAVRLTCGRHVLSTADNWYVPARLTDAMNEALANTDTPFGQVVAPLHFHRTRVQPPAWAGDAHPFEVRQAAVLVTAAGVPFSLVRERYTSELTRGR